MNSRDDWDSEGVLALAAALDEKDSTARGRHRLLATLEGVHRFPDLEEQVAALFGIDAERATHYLLALDRTGAHWESGPAPGVSLLHVHDGVGREDAIAGFVRLEPRAVFPRHRHAGRERVLVLQREMREEESGRVFTRAAFVASDQDVEHAVRASSPIPTIYAVVIERGVWLGDSFIGPSDPRM
jgi:quercetin dioxygenase-like cupin family protein